jgi:alkanesulfonate monooxygenase SsuD/methylene tetrahydromethanopterin reductase-like flavin-dependent oxidoreductase (luciferase family)
MADHGVTYRTRFQLLKEQLGAIKEIWTKDESEFHGRFVNFDKMKAFPKPTQHPHPPIIMGGAGAKSLECAAEVCDGWAPWLMDWSKAKESIVEIKRQAAAHARDADAMEFSLFEKSIPDERIMAEMEKAGVRRIILTVYAQNREEALPILDRLANVIG